MTTFSYYATFCILSKLRENIRLPSKPMTIPPDPTNDSYFFLTFIFMTFALKKSHKFFIYYPQRTSISFQVFRARAIASQWSYFSFCYLPLALYRLTFVIQYLPRPSPQTSSMSCSYGRPRRPCCSGQWAPSAHRRPGDISSQYSCGPRCCSPRCSRKHSGRLRVR